MTVPTSSSPPAPESREARHRAGGGRGYGREAQSSGPIPVPRRDGGRHRAPDAAPSGGPSAVPAPREAEPGPGQEHPGAGFRPLPPSGFSTSPPDAAGSGGVSSIGVPLGAVPVQRQAVVPRRRPSRVDPGAVHDDDAVTAPVRREALDRAAARGPADTDPPTAAAPVPVGAPALRPLAVQRPEAAPSPHPYEPHPDEPRPEASSPYRPEPAGSHRREQRPEPFRPAAPRRGSAPWETPLVDQVSARVGLAALVTGVLGVLVGLGPWSGLLPRVLPQSALGVTPVFNLVGALLGVLGLGLGAVAMFRAEGTSRGLLVGVVGSCAGAAAVVVGLVV